MGFIAYETQNGSSLVVLNCEKLQYCNTLSIFQITVQRTLKILEGPDFILWSVVHRFKDY